MSGAALDAATTLAAEGIECTVVDPRWVLPVSEPLVSLAAGYSVAVTVEDGVRVGGVGGRIGQALSATGADTTVVNIGLPCAYIPHGSRTELLSRFGLDAPGIAGTIRTLIDRPVVARLRSTSGPR